MAAKKTCRTHQRDAFDAVAYRLWQDEHRMDQLMAANIEYMDVLLFDAGTVLNVPEVEIQNRVAELPPWYREE